MSTKKKPQTMSARLRHAPRPTTPPEMAELISAVLNHPETPALVRTGLSDAIEEIFNDLGDRGEIAHSVEYVKLVLDRQRQAQAAAGAQ